jgi:hypothetical protein
MGTYSGTVKWVHAATGVEESNVPAHNSAVTYAYQAADTNLLLTSSAFVRPLSCLWRIEDNLEVM